MSSAELGEFLQQKIDQQGIAITDLSTKTALSRQTIYKLLHGEMKDPKLSTLVVLGRALHVHPQLLFRNLFKGWESRTATTPRPITARDAIGFLGDISFPDNSMVSVNKFFTKTWEIQNIGLTPWIGRRLVCVDNQLEVHRKSEVFNDPASQRGLMPEQREIPIDDLKPGDSIRLSVDFTAPAFPCSAISYWKMVDKNGVFCFPEHEGLSCLVQVVTF